MTGLGSGDRSTSSSQKLPISRNIVLRRLGHIDAEGAEVWGLLYEVDRELVRRVDGERSVLDRIEGHRTESGLDYYRPVEVTVLLDGRCCVSCFVPVCGGSVAAVEPKSSS